MRKRQKGFSLVELLMVSGLAAAGTMVTFSEKQLSLEQERAKENGQLLYQYNNAVKSWLSDNPSPANNVMQGSVWLKPSSCGGLSPVGYLPCSFPDATPVSPISFGQLALSSTIATTGVAPNTETTVTTRTSPFVVERTRADLSGLSAITASASSTHGSFSSDPSTSAITLMTSSHNEGETWLRVDGGNQMTNNISFDPTQSTDRRQVNNISRLQSIAGETLFLGNIGGAASNSALIVDANQDTLGRLIVRNNSGHINGIELMIGSISAATGNVSAAGVVSAGGAITSGGDITAGGILRSGSGGVQTTGDIQASGDIIAGANVRGQIFYDSNDMSYYLDPNATSRLNGLNVTGITNFNEMTSFNHGVTLAAIATEGTWCGGAPGLIRRNTAGDVLTCSNNYWKRQANWHAGNVSAGASCATSGPGSFAFDGARNLYVCK